MRVLYGVQFNHPTFGEVKINVTEGDSTQVPILLGQDFLEQRRMDLLHDGVIEYEDADGTRRRMKIDKSGKIPLLSLAAA